MKHFLSLENIDKDVLLSLINEAVLFKKDRPSYGRLFLDGKSVALLFEKPSTRTRVSFEVGVLEMGGKTIFLSSFEVGLGKREAIKDVARTLSRYVHALIIRTFAHSSVEELAAYSTVPVINALSDFLHPCQALSDMFTIRERFGRLEGINLCFIGDANNVFRSLAYACAKLGVRMHYACPKKYGPDSGFVEKINSIAQENGYGEILSGSNDLKEAVAESDVLYTDVWASMGQEKELLERQKAFASYQINEQLLFVAKEDAVVMHCLPAHRGEEITDEIIESPRSIVFDQAENRLHMQKAVLTRVLGQEGM